MRRNATLGILALATLLWTGCSDQREPLAPDAQSSPGERANVVTVDPPAGNPADDRASILDALDAVRPGGTVQFGPGEYVIGLTDPFSLIPVAVSSITLLGHPAGTTLRGCDTEEIQFGICMGLLLSGANQAVRNIEFLGMDIALLLGRVPFDPPATGVGGHRIEGNTFRNSSAGVIGFGPWTLPSVIRHNTFTNVAEAVSFWGSTFHVLDNEISAPDPAAIPDGGHAFSAVLGLSFDLFATGPCDHNIIARNRIEGYRWGAGVEVIAGETCSHNVIRDNTIVDSRISEGFALGAPLLVWNETAQEELMEHNLVQGNRVLGAEGLGAVILRASHTRVVNNTFQAIEPSPDGQWLGAADGSGVWISAGSSQNRVQANAFNDLASYAVVLEGDHNHVATTSAGDDVLDLGSDNRVTGPGSSHASAAVGSDISASWTATDEGGEPALALPQRAGPGTLLRSLWMGREESPR